MNMTFDELRKKLDEVEAMIPEAGDKVGITADVAITADDSEGSVYGIDDVVLYRYEPDGDRYGVALFLSHLGNEWNGNMHEIAHDGQVRRVQIEIQNVDDNASHSEERFEMNAVLGRSIEDNQWKLALRPLDEEEGGAAA